MNNQPVVSIIVPVYKTEKYLRQCVESVLAQSYINWELILVNDGSPDNCGRICDEYAAADNRIKTIHTSNQGLSCARNTGVENSSGEFITFLDSDDQIHPEFLRLLMKHSASADLICADFIYNKDCTKAFDFSGPIDKRYNRKAVEYSGREFLKDILYQKRIGCNHSAWGKIFHKSKLKFPFTPGILYEDLDFFYHIVPGLNRIVIIPETLYFYLQRQQSILHIFNSKRADILDITDQMKTYFSPQGEFPDKDLYKASQDRRLSAHFNILGLMCANDYNDTALEERCWRGIKLERMQSLFNPNVRIRNKLAVLLTLIGGRFLYKKIARHFYRDK